MDYWKQGKIKLHLLSIGLETKEYFVSSFISESRRLFRFPVHEK
jgi:hypothetical protein